MTQFRARRNFLRRPGVDVAAGDVIECDDGEAALLVALGGTVEPVNAADRRRILVVDTVIWEPAAESERRQRAETAGQRLRFASASDSWWRGWTMH